MADTIVTKAKDGEAFLHAWFKRLKLSSNGANAGLTAMKRRCWYSSDSDPAVTAASRAVAPVQVGDPALRIDTDEAFICSAAPTATTAAAFIQLHVDP